MARSWLASEAMKQKITLQLLLNGADCASCAVGLERVIRGIPGVSAVAVNPVAETVMVEYDDERANPGMFADRLLKTYGFRAELVTERMNAAAEAPDHEDSARSIELKNLRHKVVLGMALSTILVIVAFSSLVPASIRNYVLFALATPVMFFVGGHFFSSFVRGLRHRNANMDTLVAVGTGTAYLYSTVVTFVPNIFGSVRAETYYDIGAVVITLILLGRYFEARAKGSANQAIRKLLELGAKTARVIRDGQELDIAVEHVQVGDIILVRPGEKVAVDGEVVEGRSTVDQSVVTGESIPVEKKPGDTVI